jgi:hypothetical protein
MAVAFTSLVTMVVSERLGLGIGRRLFKPLVAVGVGTVLYWSWSESVGAGDLRPYIFVQAFPLLMIPYLLWRVPGRYTRGPDLLIALGLYFVAKACELLDPRIFELGNIVSGHTLKHIAAGLACYWLARMVRLREVA